MNRFPLNFGSKDATNNITVNKQKKITNLFNNDSESLSETVNKVVYDGTLVFSTDNTIDTSEEQQNLVIPCKNRLNKSRKGLDYISSTKNDQEKPLMLPEDDIARQVILDAQKNDDLFEYKKEMVVTTPILMRSGSIIGEDKADYEHVPVESFGLAMLMGMGYDPNKPTNVSSPDVLLNKRRIYDKAGLGSHDTLLKITQQIDSGDNNYSKATSSSKVRDDINDVVWVSKGLVVKIIDRCDKYYKHKGDVVGIDKYLATVNFEDGMRKGYKIKYLETVVKEGEDAKIVLPTLHPINSSQLLGRYVKVIKKGRSSATVEMSGKKFELPLDSICYYNYKR
ncbi:glutamate--cysteine ligase catalytic subunit [Babesia microti strain RI]|uniref:Glutamate--cysteine ligase catalytic subunit n=1 Tax=Babesia microti (strain RI) TaxID=1133968 RepID=I7I8S8_BABMR|nr:glutamate--cysteine ligase catalytic subunit [Babesia microti strain RI]CCF73613.1 glutamate--cysteine ligase catalytic subunit [Babesia microti strain RI]|eukprot:XP_012648222.1 glutamate--cysteine ligase catalytic subunit [Babesia microti strain RI]